jgi:hypothetical protein
MNRTETACYSLIASAFLLAGLLIVQVSSTPNTADAALVIARDNFTLMTAKTRSNEESLFVLNNSTSKLLIYSLDIGRERLELAGGADLAEIFGRASGNDGDGGRRRR